jgi:methionine synthase reductase
MPSLVLLCVAVLGPEPVASAGLGDTNYDNFCESAKKLDKQMEALGATSFHAKAYADDAYG